MFFEREKINRKKLVYRMSVLVLSLYITLFILFMSVTLYSLLCVPSKLCQLTIKRFAKKMKTFY